MLTTVARVGYPLTIPQVGTPSQTYVREYSTGTLLRTTVQLYRRHFWKLIAVYAIPTLPFMLLQQEAQIRQNWTFVIVCLLGSLLTSGLAYGAMTFAVADICLGQRPTVRGCYRRITGKAAARLLWTNVLFMMGLTTAAIFLLVPAFILFVRWFFISIIPVLEGSSGVAALKRSSRLGSGYHLRNAGIILVWMCVLIVLQIAVEMFSLMVGGIIGAGPLALRITVFAISVWSVVVMCPLLYTSATLMYYDLRVRKEAYNVTALSEDLRR